MDKYFKVVRRDIRGGSSIWIDKSNASEVVNNEFFDNNQVSNNIFFIKVSGVWRQCITWIKVSGVWRQSNPKININNTWR